MEEKIIIGIGVCVIIVVLSGVYLGGTNQVGFFYVVPEPTEAYLVIISEITTEGCMFEVYASGEGIPDKIWNPDCVLPETGSFHATEDNVVSAVGGTKALIPVQHYIVKSYSLYGDCPGTVNTETKTCDIKIDIRGGYCYENGRNKYDEEYYSGSYCPPTGVIGGILNPMAFKWVFLDNEGDDVDLFTNLTDIIPKSGCNPQTDGEIMPGGDIDVVDWNSIAYRCCKISKGNQHGGTYHRTYCNRLSPDSGGIVYDTEKRFFVSAMEYGSHSYGSSHEGVTEYSTTISTTFKVSPEFALDEENAVWCGNGICETDETWENCPVDCAGATIAELNQTIQDQIQAILDANMTIEEKSKKLADLIAEWDLDANQLQAIIDAQDMTLEEKNEIIANLEIEKIEWDKFVPVGGSDQNKDDSVGVVGVILALVGGLGVIFVIKVVRR